MHMPSTLSTEMFLVDRTGQVGSRPFNALRPLPGQRMGRALALALALGGDASGK